MKFTNFFSINLSRKLLSITVALIMIAQIMILIPTAARFRGDWLRQNIQMAETSAMLMQVITPDDLTDKEWRQIFDALSFYNIEIKKDERVTYIAINEDIPNLVRTTEYVTDRANFTDIMRFFSTLSYNGNRIILAKGKSNFSGNEINIEFQEDKLYKDILNYIFETLSATLLLSIMVGSVLYFILARIFIRPLKLLTREMEIYSANPNQFTTISSLHFQQDEIGTLSKGLSHLKSEVSTALKKNQSLATLGLAVAKISHDLRNVLTAAQLISDRIALNADSKTADYSQKLVLTIDRAVDLCQSTLFYGKLDTLQIHKTEFLFTEITSEIEVILNLSLKNNQILLKLVFDPNLTIYADKEQLLRVLTNLCRNACHALYNQYENKAPQIIIQAVKQHNTTLIDIIDNGPGIPKHLLEGLFQPFQSTASTGTGLGLAIAKDLIEAHGGSITLVKTNTGTHFRILIPTF